MKDPELKSDLSIVLAGEAGQGIQLIENILVALARKKGYHVYATKEYMSRVRGGMNSTSIRISTKPVAALVDRIDLAIPLAPGGLEHLGERLGKKTRIIVDEGVFPETSRSMIEVPLSSLAKEIGGPIYTNTVVAGIFCAIIGVDPKTAEEYVGRRFAKKGEEVIEKNRLSIRKGFELGSGLSLGFALEKPEKSSGQRITLAGADAVALGALAGGCDYVCGYPMSPSTSVLEKLASYSQRHELIAEQVEDEVGVVNMALGAWYAGARALVTTSGGGFALMCEGISLAGMIETPLVVYLAQRPGPATGLPTRTEQGDLNLVLYAGHGDFPRIILAPGSLEEGFSLTQKAFELSDKFQVPVFVLTDQYYVDTYYDTKRFKVPEMPERHIVATEASYKRYAVTKDGISPRGIPGFGKGVVAVDSDEHDESGHIIEDAKTRLVMADKRMRKAKALLRAAIKPVIIGNPDAKNLVVTWGSTFPLVNEALENLGRKDTALVHFPWVFPLPANTAGILGSAKKLIVVEGNMTGQFADLLWHETGIKANSRILKYDGRPFSVEELTARLEGELSPSRSPKRQALRKGA